jgi:putative addiction module CopG family antidote
MTIELKPEHQRMIQLAIQSGAYHDTDEVIGTALSMLTEDMEQLLKNGDSVDAKIQRGIGEIRRGEGIPEDKLDAHLAKLKALPE